MSIAIINGIACIVAIIAALATCAFGYALLEGETAMKKPLIVAIITLVVAGGTMFFTNTQTEGFSRWMKSIDSSYGGIERSVIVYDYDGDIIASYHGNFDVVDNDQEVSFDLNGQRTIVQGGIVLIQEEDEAAYEARLEAANATAETANNN